MITSYMIFVNQKYYAWLLFFLTNSGTNLTKFILYFVIGQTERLFDYQSNFQSKFQSKF